LSITIKSDPTPVALVSYAPAGLSIIALTKWFLSSHLKYSERFGVISRVARSIV